MLLISIFQDRIPIRKRIVMQLRNMDSILCLILFDQHISPEHIRESRKALRETQDGGDMVKPSEKIRLFVENSVRLWSGDIKGLGRTTGFCRV